VSVHEVAQPLGEPRISLDDVEAATRRQLRYQGAGDGPGAPPASKTLSGRRACLPTASVSARAKALPLGATAPTVRKSRSASAKNAKPSAWRHAKARSGGVVDLFMSSTLGNGTHLRTRRCATG
jgi:hypothetical protein